MPKTETAGAKPAAPVAAQQDPRAVIAHLQNVLTVTRGQLAEANNKAAEFEAAARVNAKVAEAEKARADDEAEKRKAAEAEIQKLRAKPPKAGK